MTIFKEISYNQDYLSLSKWRYLPGVVESESRLHNDIRHVSF